MKYKTIVLERLKEHPNLHELTSNRTLLSTIEGYAKELKRSHEAWKECLLGARPESHEAQISIEALELALKDLEELFH